MVFPTLGQVKPGTQGFSNRFRYTKNEEFFLSFTMIESKPAMVITVGLLVYNIAGL